MLTAGVSTVHGKPVSACQINVEKSFAFLEFHNPEDATAGMALDGITLQGQALKVRRPKDYQAPSAVPATVAPVQLSPTGPNSSVYIPGIVSTNVPDTPNKIFVGGLPSFLNEEQVKELLSSFGPLRSFNLVKDSTTGNSKGYAFFEYMDASVTDRACENMNGMKLGDKTLLVQRANVGAKASSPPPVAPIQPVQSSTASTFLNLLMPAGTLLGSIMQGNSAQQPERVLMLLNMVSPEDLVDEEEYRDILDDVREEVMKYGVVERISLPRPPVKDNKIDTSLPQETEVGKVFVKYDSKDAAARAQKALAGRKFSGRTVLTCYWRADGGWNPF
eukprot:TRINITY_DN14371_c0_g1_i1.p1 TRINITY_DN14371_c0_g1~~TRINITY_DN14371_c0_g1_i1.p1  ORF type:complete len:332 (+),score=92.27 TRINITY_DN14371_c0_g1_i1:513-1508(+)